MSRRLVLSNGGPGLLAAKRQFSPPAKVQSQSGPTTEWDNLPVGRQAEGNLMRCSARDVIETRVPLAGKRATLPRGEGSDLAGLAGYQRRVGRLPLG